MENETIVTESNETPIVEQAVTTENAEPNNETVETKPEKTFTQSELDGIITKRLERERETTAKKVAQESRDALIVEENIVYNGKQIKTEAEYRQMQKEQEIRKEYEGKALDEDVMNELIEGKKFREQYQTKEQETQAKAKVESDFQDFVSAFPDAKAEDIPQSVWDEVAKGKSLVDAYTRHENTTLKQRLTALEQKQQIEQQNAENAASSTGSVTGQGSVDPSFISAESFEKNRSDAGWVKKNFSKIVESRAKW